MFTISINLTLCIGYACRADKNPYRHDRCADKNPYRHDRRADKNTYRHDRRADSQCPIRNLNIKINQFVYLDCVLTQYTQGSHHILKLRVY